MQEIECKLRLDDRNGVIERLRRFGAVHISTQEEKNKIMDTADRQLELSAKALRLRTIAGVLGGVVTYKGAPEKSRYKSREEIEFFVEDTDSFLIMMNRLGYTNVWQYEKKRSTWTLNSCSIVLDELPVLGDFIEIEAQNEEQIDSVLSALGLCTKDHISFSYRELWIKHCVEHGKPIEDWLF